MNARIDELAKQAGLHREWFIDHPEIEEFVQLVWGEAFQKGSEAGWEEAVLKERG